jgi:hypothetical protein
MMTRVIVAVAMFAFLSVSIACAGNESTIEGSVGPDLGVVPVGGIPKDMSVFVSSDCGTFKPKFADCSAQDGEGRRYAFFNGALSKVSASRSEATEALRLPAGIEFGEDVESAAKKVVAVFNIKLERGASPNGLIVYSSDYVVRSSAGRLYSVELIADEKGHLTEVVERTDF